MEYLSPAVVLILIVAAALIFIRFAKKLFFHWALLIILEIALFIFWPKSLEIIANFVAVIKAIVIK